MTETEITPVYLPTGKKHTSFSETRNWAECSWRHQLQAIKKLGIDSPSIHLFFGTATHAAIEYFMNTKDISFVDSDKVIDDGWVENLKLPDFIKNPADKMKQGIRNIMEEFPKFMEVTFPGYVSIEAEEQLYEDLGKYFNQHAGVSFKGFIDIVIKVPGKKEGSSLYWILDAKTASRPWDANKIADPLVRMQLVLYKKFWCEKHNIPLKDVRCGFVICLKQGKVGKLCKLIPVSVGDVSVTKSLAVVNNFVSSVKRGVAYKNRMSCRFCEFKDTKLCT